MSHDDWIIHIRSGLASVANCHANVANGQKDSGVQGASLFFSVARARRSHGLCSPCSATLTPSSIAPAMSGSEHCTHVTSRVHRPARAHPPLAPEAERRPGRRRENKMRKMTGGEETYGRSGPHERTMQCRIHHLGSTRRHCAS